SPILTRVPRRLTLNFAVHRSRANPRGVLRVRLINHRANRVLLEELSVSHQRIGLERLPIRTRMHDALRLAIEPLEQRRLLSAPVLEAISNQSVPANKTIQVPLRDSDADGDALSYSVSSNNSSVTASLRS